MFQSWSFLFKHPVPSRHYLQRKKYSHSNTPNHPVIGDELGNIYISAFPREHSSTALNSFSSEGQLNWVVTHEGSVRAFGSGAIGYDNLLYPPVVYNGVILFVN